MNMNHIETGHWSYSISKKRIEHMLVIFLLFTCMAGCNQQEGTLPVTASPLLSPEPRPTPLFRGFVLPAWMELELPPSCRLGRLSQDLQWLTYACRSGSKNFYEGWLAQAHAGQINNPRFLGRVGGWGFTSDGSGLIVERDDTWWVINLSDFTQQPYPSGTRGFPDPSTAGWAWSPDGSLIARCSNNNCREILVFSPDSQAFGIVIEKTTLNASQFSWSPDGQEIAYVDGFPTVGDGSMTARVLNLQTRQSRTLIEDKIDLSGASCSPDGKWIAVRAVGESQHTILWLVDPQGGSSIKLEYEDLKSDRNAKDGGWQDLVWSPDGSKLALSGWNAQSDSGWIVIEAPTGKVAFRAAREDGFALLGWSTDGTSLLALGYDIEKEREILRWVSVQP
jgi:hypothetical protein